MGRKRRPNEPPSYEKAPTVPPELEPRVDAVIQVLAKQITMVAGAERVGIARPNFQTLVHRAKAALVEALAPRPSGRPARPEEEERLRAEVDRLSRENARLTARVATIDRLLGVAGKMLRGEVRPARQTSTRSSQSSTSSSTGKKDPEDPDPAGAILAEETAMRDAGVPAALRALALGKSVATMRRWRRRRATGDPLRRVRPAAPPAADAMAEARRVCRELKGLVGAAALAKTVPGVSRRQAAAIKATELMVLERERRQSCGRVEVAAPGLIRGFDAMYVWTTAGWRFPLIAGDAAVPYRTSILVVESYDTAAVERAICADLEAHGAPLVYRLDRAACQREPRIVSLLKAHSVLILHGPPHHPGYYGQLERQNREHRAWLDHAGVLAPSHLVAECETMMLRLNGLWRRRSLDWRTAECVWEQRPPVTIDRNELGQDVEDRADRIVAGGAKRDLADRLAIEQVLAARGLLHVQPGERVLRA